MCCSHQYNQKFTMRSLLLNIRKETYGTLLSIDHCETWLLTTFRNSTEGPSSGISYQSVTLSMVHSNIYSYMGFG